MMHRAAELRKEMTPAEQRLWARLRQNQVRETAFRRQHAIGPYIVDFCSVKRKLVIELDGSPHQAQEEYDAQRSKYLEEEGYMVLRFWNHEVMENISAVLETIDAAVGALIKRPSEQ
jgi:very-short-patch-repair endonuclease